MDSILSFSKRTNRNTQAFVIHLGPHAFYISYETIIAYHGSGHRVRLFNSWGTTTGKHINEMGLSDFKIVGEEELNSLINQAVLETGCTMAAERMGMRRKAA